MIDETENIVYYSEEVITNRGIRRAEAGIFIRDDAAAGEEVKNDVIEK